MGYESLNNFTFCFVQVSHKHVRKENGMENVSYHAFNTRKETIKLVKGK